MRLQIRFDEKAFVLYDPSREWLFAADPAGRITMIHTPEVSYKRSRFNVWYKVLRDPWPSLEEIPLETIQSRMRQWHEVWKDALAQTKEQTFLQKVLKSWVEEFQDFHQQDAQVFSSVYKSIPILPPDAYQSLYLRIQQGCPWNQCAFCSFYQGTAFHIPELAELESHFASVRTYWNGAIRSRHGIFLGDANAIATPVHVLAERLRLVQKCFPENELRGIHSFLDYFVGTKRNSEDFEVLRNLGLKRVSLGIESGASALMEKVRKPMSRSDLIHMVAEIGSAGISMNLIFIVGLGGRAWREAHYSGSIDLLSHLQLDKKDRIYLSPLVIDPQTPYSVLARQEGWISLREAELEAELASWQKAIQRLCRVQVSLYNIRQFIY